MPHREKPYDLIRRGEKKPTASGTLTFIGLRLADIPLQRALLSPSASGVGARFLTALGLRTIYTHASTPLSSVHILGEAGPRTSLLLLFMGVGSAAKQIYWQTATSQESFPVSAAVAVSVYNTLVNSANSLLFLALGTTSLLSRPRVPLSFFTADGDGPGDTLPLSTLLGTLLYVSGSTLR